MVLTLDTLAFRQSVQRGVNKRHERKKTAKRIYGRRKVPSTSYHASDSLNRLEIHWHTIVTTTATTTTTTTTTMTTTMAATTITTTKNTTST
ncbi:hypothetical protein HZH66_003092 [Vespula vulgaris]|uniref:Uncharacterized protein n=1 Tax=Vespula vulgaris TaxID=7454 RepID=A0A834NFU8_VESVU|nr:hypothetical protein HZH66_003092 [Vespula vulgaris]